MNEIWHKRFLDQAKMYASWSKDPNTQVGSVAVDPEKKTILSGGFNGFPRGILDIEERLNDRPTKYKYTVHSEMNCLYNALYSGVSLNKSYLYVYGLPVCSECAKGIIQAGISKVIIPKLKEIPERWQESWSFTKLLFEESGVEILEIDYE